jgi:hypothetical protein
VSTKDKYRYICDQFGYKDGGQIFDRKLFEAIAGVGVDIERFTPNHFRRKSIMKPLWSRSIAEHDIRSLKEYQTAGDKVILSHEKLYDIAEAIKVDAVIVHNYWPAFSYPGQTLLEHYYRFRSRSYFRKIFNTVEQLFFVSRRDMRKAINDFPDVAYKCHLIQPPPMEMQLQDRSFNSIHLSGSDDWYAKRICKLTQSDIQTIKGKGFGLCDFSETRAPCFALINDRFRVGFKLKLMQMLYMGDIIASFCDLREEISELVGDYPYYKQVKNVDEMLMWFSEVQTEGKATVDEKIKRCLRDAKFPCWENTARKVIHELSA